MSDICGWSWPNTRLTTTGDDPIAAANSARRGPITLSPTSPGSGSTVGPLSAAFSANTSGLRRSPGQGRWPTSGTPQAVGHCWTSPGIRATCHGAVTRDHSHRWRKGLRERVAIKTTSFPRLIASASRRRWTRRRDCTPPDQRQNEPYINHLLRVAIRIIGHCTVSNAEHRRGRVRQARYVAVPITHARTPTQPYPSGRFVTPATARTTQSLAAAQVTGEGPCASSY